MGLFFEGRLKIEFKESDVSFTIAFFSKERGFFFSRDHSLRPKKLGLKIVYKV